MEMNFFSAKSNKAKLKKIKLHVPKLKLKKPSNKKPLINRQKYLNPSFETKKQQIKNAVIKLIVGYKISKMLANKVSAALRANSFI